MYVFRCYFFCCTFQRNNISLITNHWTWTRNTLFQIICFYCDSIFNGWRSVYGFIGMRRCLYCVPKYKWPITCEQMEQQHQTTKRWSVEKNRNSQHSNADICGSMWCSSDWLNLSIVQTHTRTYESRPQLRTTLNKIQNR